MSDETPQAQAPVNMAAPPSVWQHRSLVFAARREAQECVDLYVGLYGRPMLTPVAAVIEQLGDRADRALDSWETQQDGWERAHRNLLVELERVREQLSQARIAATKANQMDTEVQLAGANAELAVLRRAVTRYASSKSAAARTLQRAEEARVSATLNAVEERHTDAA